MGAVPIRAGEAMDHRLLSGRWVDLENGAETRSAALECCAIEGEGRAEQSGFRVFPVGAAPEGIDLRLDAGCGIDREHCSGSDGTASLGGSVETAILVEQSGHRVRTIIAAETVQRGQRPRSSGGWQKRRGSAKRGGGKESDGKHDGLSSAFGNFSRLSGRIATYLV